MNVSAFPGPPLTALHSLVGNRREKLLKIMYHTTDSCGVTRVNPSLSDQAAILDTLQEEGPEPADVWLAHDSGWRIVAYPNGNLLLENENKPAVSLLLRAASKQKTLLLWQHLARGDLKEVRKEPWISESS